MLTHEMTDEQFQQHAISILQRELGPEGLARFLRLYRSGGCNYTEDRQRWLQDITVDQIVAQIQSRQEPR